jgi:hypothetical protein
MGTSDELSANVVLAVQFNGRSIRGHAPGQVVIQQHSIPTDTLGGNGPTDRDLCRQAYMIAGL